MTKRIAKPPLTPAVFHILLALSDEARHGYAIMKQVQSDSQGQVKMGPGTLYGSIGRMMDADLIQECDKAVDRDTDDARRVYYQLTGLGESVLSAELDRFRKIVNIAKQKRLKEVPSA